MSSLLASVDLDHVLYKRDPMNIFRRIRRGRRSNNPVPRLEDLNLEDAFIEDHPDAEDLASDDQEDADEEASTSSGRQSRIVIQPVEDRTGEMDDLQKVTILYRLCDDLEKIHGIEKNYERWQDRVNDGSLDFWDVDDGHGLVAMDASIPWNMRVTDLRLR